LFSSLWGVTGVFIALPAADALTVLVSGYLLIKYRKKFKYA
jgi:Na+-driven multidrug efflux pump